MARFFQLAHLAVALAVSLLLTGCRNTDPTTGTTTVSGQVLERFSRQPVANATVQVYLASTGGGYRPTGQQATADANGRFAFSFEAREKYGYILLASKPPGYQTEWVLAPYLTSGRRNEDLTIPVLAPAWVKVQLVDEPPKSKIHVYISGYEGNGDELYYPRDTTLIRPGLANLTSRVIWVISEGGVTRQAKQDIKLGALDTVTVRIPF